MTTPKKKNKAGAFDAAIDAIGAVVDFYAAPRDTVQSCLHAIAVLKAAGKADPLNIIDKRLHDAVKKAQEAAE